MVKGKDAYRNELLQTYIRWQNTEVKHHSRHMQCLARDHQRKIRKVFKDNFHEDIDEVIKNENVVLIVKGE